MGFTQFTTEHGIYVVWVGDDRVFLALYVDDLLLVWKNKKCMEWVKRKLRDNFWMKDLESAQYLLGVEIKRKLEGGFFIVQEKYAKDVVLKFGMGEAKFASTSFEVGSVMGMAEAGDKVGKAGSEDMAEIPYRGSKGGEPDVSGCLYKA